MKLVLKLLFLLVLAQEGLCQSKELNLENLLLLKKWKLVMVYDSQLNKKYPGEPGVGSVIVFNKNGTSRETKKSGKILEGKWQIVDQTLTIGNKKDVVKLFVIDVKKKSLRLQRDQLPLIYLMKAKRK